MPRIAVVNEVHSIAVRIQGWMMKDLGFEVYLAGGSFQPLVPNYNFGGKVDPEIFAGVMEVAQLPKDAIFLDTHPDTEKRFRAKGLQNPIMLVWQMPVGPEWVRDNFRPGPRVGSLGWSTSVGREITRMGLCPNDHFWPAYPAIAGLTPRDGFSSSRPVTVVENAQGWSNLPVLEKLRDDPRVKLELFGGGPPAWSRRIPQPDLFAKIRQTVGFYHLKPFDTPGLAVMEAAVQGVPILFPPDWLRTTQATDIFEDGKSCVVVQTDVEDVVRALARLADPEENRRIGHEGARRLREAMDWTKNKPRLLKLVDDICQDRIDRVGHPRSVTELPLPPIGSSASPVEPLHPVLAAAKLLADQVSGSKDDRPEWLAKKVDEPEPRTFYYRFLWKWAMSRKPKVMVETGTLHGHSAIHLAEGHPQGQVVTIDSDPARTKEVLALREANIMALTGESLEIFERVKEVAPAIDVLFLDSSMRYPHMLEEYRKYSELVVPGGIIFVDDIHINPDMERVWAEIPGKKLELNGLHYMGFGVVVKE